MNARSVTELVAQVAAGKRPHFVFFWGHRPAANGTLNNSCFSQWWPSPFTVRSTRYATSEHYMMAAKARLFDDHEALAGILATGSPKVAKAIGRTVRGYDDAVWSAARVQAVVEGNRAKFTSTPQLRAFLLATRSKVLVEASPVDRVWGIGLAHDDPAARNPRLWRGQNLLGFALMDVRDQL